MLQNTTEMYKLKSRADQVLEVGMDNSLVSWLYSRERQAVVYV